MTLKLKSEMYPEPATDTAHVNHHSPTDNHLFDVTQIIGSVYASNDDTLSPRQAAFLVIADFAANGTVTFPAADGSICSVTVEHRPATRHD